MCLWWGEGWGCNFIYVSVFYFQEKSGELDNIKRKSKLSSKQDKSRIKKINLWYISLDDEWLEKIKKGFKKKKWNYFLDEYLVLFLFDNESDDSFDDVKMRRSRKGKYYDSFWDDVFKKFKKKLKRSKRKYFLENDFLFSFESEEENDRKRIRKGKNKVQNDDEMDMLGIYFMLIYFVYCFRFIVVIIRFLCCG